MVCFGGILYSISLVLTDLIEIYRVAQKSKLLYCVNSLLF